MFTPRMPLWMAMQNAAASFAGHAAKAGGVMDGAWGQARIPVMPDTPGLPPSASLPSRPGLVRPAAQDWSRSKSAPDQNLATTPKGCPPAVAANLATTAKGFPPAAPGAAVLTRVPSTPKRPPRPLSARIFPARPKMPGLPRASAGSVLSRLPTTPPAIRAAGSGGGRLPTTPPGVLPSSPVLLPRDEAEEQRQLQAALAASKRESFSPGASGAAASSSAGGCVVCMDSSATHIVIPCGHQCVCNACSEALQKGDATCPVCRTPAKQFIRVFASGIHEKSADSETTAKAAKKEKKDKKAKEEKKEKSKSKKEKKDKKEVSTPTRKRPVEVIGLDEDMPLSSLLPAAASAASASARPASAAGPPAAGPPAARPQAAGPQAAGLAAARPPAAGPPAPAVPPKAAAQAAPVGPPKAAAPAKAAAAAPKAPKAKAASKAKAKAGTKRPLVDPAEAAEDSPAALARATQLLSSTYKACPTCKAAFKQVVYSKQKLLYTVRCADAKKHAFDLHRSTTWMPEAKRQKLSRDAAAAAPGSTPAGAAGVAAASSSSSAAAPRAPPASSGAAATAPG
eukprot:TRINITY_DN8945_c0_g1_i4.p1 TRINITY_DN8945_c0_g1~~TRINITY_DN8945_c0_g1_i4.p1  ORF type:complete len:567 (-),score=151.52 TRINITY_DN8945_c0_g1_i4:333-2033(-)